MKVYPNWCPQPSAIFYFGSNENLASNQIDLLTSHYFFWPIRFFKGRKKYLTIRSQQAAIRRPMNARLNARPMNAMVPAGVYKIIRRISTMSNEE